MDLNRRPVIITSLGGGGLIERRRNTVSDFLWQEETNNQFYRFKLIDCNLFSEGINKISIWKQ